MEIFTEEDAMAAQLSEERKAKIEERVGRVIQLGTLVAYRMLNGDDSEGRAIAALALQRMEATEESLEEEMANACSGGREAKIVEAVEGGIRKATGMLGSENPKERAIGTIALGRIGDKRGISILENVMESERDGSVLTLMAATLENLRSMPLVLRFPRKRAGNGHKTKAGAPEKGKNKA